MDRMRSYIDLMRTKDWVKNLFLYIPAFFAGDLFEVGALIRTTQAAFLFCLTASSIYIFNDFRDLEDDRKHPTKRYRPIASGRIKPVNALILCVFLAQISLGLAFYLDYRFGLVLSVYFLINLAYTFGLKRVSILDVIIVAIGFNLRIKAGSIMADVPLSEWVVIMVFLLSLFMALGKRRDDVLLKQATGVEMRASSRSYNLDYLNVLIALICAIIIVAYLMYTISPAVYIRLGTHRLYYTCLFVIAGIFRYLQIIFVSGDSESPTKIFLKDRFIQISVVLWIASFILLIYFKNFNLFK